MYVLFLGIFYVHQIQSSWPKAGENAVRAAGVPTAARPDSREC